METRATATSADQKQNSAPQAPNAAASAEPWTVQRILSWTTEHLKKHGSEAPRLESEVLLAHARKCHRIQLYTHFNEEVDEQTRATMRDLVKRRCQHEPVAYLVGHREFFSLDFYVQPGVFIPRPETESLVIEALEAVASVETPRILDVCTGSGCIAVSIAVRKPGAQVTAIDKNPLACEITQKNAQRHQVDSRVNVLHYDLYEYLKISPFREPGQQLDLLVSNPPYVCTHEIAELADDIKNHEPHAALDGGTDGLDAVRFLLAEASALLKSGAWCLLEMDPSQVEPTLQLAQAAETWGKKKSFPDFDGQVRFVGLQKP